MEMKTAISCTILRHTKILIAVGVRIISLATLGSKNHTTNITKIVTQSIGIIIKRRFMIIPMLCVTIFVILVVWFLLPRVARLMIHTPTAISIFVCLSMVQLMAVFISMRCTLCGHFLQVALTLILVVGYAIAAS